MFSCQNYQTSTVLGDFLTTTTYVKLKFCEDCNRRFKLHPTLKYMGVVKLTLFCVCSRYFRGIGKFNVNEKFLPN